MAKPLAGIDSVPWDQLHHAYGTAGDVPALLEQLLSPEMCEAALEELYGTLFHQGTRYEASPHALPFLFAIAECPDTPNRAQLVGYIVAVVIGDLWEVGPAFDPYAVFPKDRAQRNWTPHYSHEVDPAEMYWAGHAHAQRLLPMLDDPDQAVVQSVVAAAAFFPALAGEALPRVRELAAKASGDGAGYDTIVALGFLAKWRDDAAPRELLAGHLASADPVVRVAAALALAMATGRLHGDTHLAALLEAITVDFPDNDLSWWCGWQEPHRFATECLRAVACEREAEVFDYLCETAGRSQGPVGSAIVDAGMELLRIRAPQSANDLTAMQRRFLETLVENRGSQLWGLNAWGLPIRREELAAFLAGGALTGNSTRPGIAARFRRWWCRWWGRSGC